MLRINLRRLIAASGALGHNSFCSISSMRLALDLAPHDAAAILSDAAGVQRASVRHAIARETLNREGTPAAWRTLTDAIREVMAQCGASAAEMTSVNLAFPARLKNGLVQRDFDTDGWNNFAPAIALARTFGFAPEKVMAYPRVLCAASGEAQFGSLQNQTSWLYLWLDAVFDTAVRDNFAARALNLGNACLDRDGIVGPNGRRGELQAYCGGESYEARAASFGLTHRSAAEIWALANSHATAQSLCEDYARRLAQGIALAQSCFDFSAVCLGGNLAATAGTRLLPMLQTALGEFCEVPQIVIGTLGRDAAVLGALALTSIRPHNGHPDFDRTAELEGMKCTLCGGATPVTYIGIRRLN
jgi:predicted NBD/HSP70 family sugar kinase